MSDIYKVRFNGNTLCSRQTRQFAHKYKSFKWVLSGRWNQGSGNSGDTATYMQWDELGIGFDGGNVCYGPSYWTYDSYTLDGTPWAADMRMPNALLDGERNTEYSKFDASNFVELTVYFHTADNNAILPTSVGLIAANGQSSYESSTPLHFMLYGLNTQTNEYELLIDVGAANVNRTNNAETIITTGFTYHYSSVTDTWPLSYTEPEHSEVWVDLGSTEYSQNRKGETVISLTGIPDTSTYNYITFVLNACYSGTGAAADILFCKTNTAWNGTMWRSRYHTTVGAIGFVGISDNVTNWTTESGQNVSSKTQDGVSYRITSAWTVNSYPVIKLVADRTNYKCYFYVNNTLIGYASMNDDMLKCKSIQICRELSRGSIPKIKNIRVAGFSTLAAAQAYNG